MSKQNVLNYFKQAGADGDNELVIGGTIIVDVSSLIDTAGSLTLGGDLTVSGGNIDAGASGAVGTVDIFPATAASGRTRFTAADNAGDTITTITNASQAGARTYTIPDAGASSSFAMLATAQTAVIGSTQAEIDLQCDVSAQTETIAAVGALAANKRISNLAVSGGGAVTLAAPSAVMLGMVKIIQMTVDTGDVTLALTNIQGGSAATTATFAAVGDTLVLVAGVSKWTVIGEGGVVLS